MQENINIKLEGRPITAVPDERVKISSYHSKIHEAEEDCDAVIIQCRKKFKFTGHFEACKLLNFTNVGSYVHQFPNKVLKRCVEAYPTHACSTTAEGRILCVVLKGRYFQG